MRHAIRLGCCAVLLSALPIDFAEAQDEAWPVDGKVVGEDGEKAEDVSGLACSTASGFPRECLIVDDESQVAQWVRLEQDRLVAGDTMQLIADTFEGEPMELDGEGAAFDAGAFYVVGSHGAPRRGADMSDEKWAARVKADSHVFRIVPGADPEDSLALRELLRADPTLAPFADQPLEDNGLTIEGVAVIGDRAFFGLRGPVLKDTCAAIFEASVAELFGGAAEPGRLHLLNLGAGRGVRDLTRLGDDLLVLAGLVGDAAGTYSVYRWRPSDADNATSGVELVADLAPLGQAKAEAILVLDAEPLRVLGLFDGPDEGEPREISLTWTKRSEPEVAIGPCDTP